MKTPRVEDFDPKATRPKRDHSLTSSLEGMPSIESPEKTQTASMPAIQQASLPESRKTSNTASQHASNTASRHNINPTEKVTYRFHPEGKYAVEDMKTILERKHGVKTSLAEIVEESILLMYEELQTNSNASKLARRLARKPESQHSS